MLSCTHCIAERERERRRNRHQRITKSHAYFIIYLFCVRFFFCIILLGPPKQPVIFFLRRYNFDSKNCYRCPLIYFFSYPFRLMHLFLIIAEKKQIIAIKQLCIAPSVYVNGVQNILTLDTNTFVLLLLRFCFVFSWIFPIWFFAVAFSSSSLFLINFNSLWIVLNICILLCFRLWYSFHRKWYRCTTTTKTTSMTENTLLINHCFSPFIFRRSLQ